MAEKLKESLTIVKNNFEEFTNFIELKDFRDFLLFTLNSQVSSNVLAQLGFGSSKDIINLPYNPLFKVYYQKIGLMSAGSLLIYVKSESLMDKFVLEKDEPIFKEYLNPNEMDLAFRAKEKFVVPKISDCTTFDSDEDTALNIKIDDLYHSLESFLAVTEPNILFVKEAESETEPDMLFAFNMTPQMPGKTNRNVLRVDVYLDYDHKTKNVKYVKREEDYSVTMLETIKEVSHSDLYKSSFSLVVKIKSFNQPY